MTEAGATASKFDSDASLTPLFRQSISALYEIEREAGRGGMATVWLARRRSDSKRFALKVLRRGVAEALGTQRFLREIGIATEVRSPALVPLEASGEIDGVLYYVMPFAEGGSLRQRIDTEHQLPLMDAVRIMRDVAVGLAALHEQGFVHRDIKPENILLGERGRAMVADFGIARAVLAAASNVNTSTGVVLGTPLYMSPEQAGGELVDARSDIYALGCVFYEILVGSPPFQGASVQAVIAQHMGQAPPALRVIRPAISEALQSVVLQALQKVPADRFESANSFARALGVIEPSSFSRSTPDVARSRPSFSVFAAGVGALLLVIAAFWQFTSPTELLDDRVVVFPFDTPGDRERGEHLALLMGSALDRTDATRWLDGLSLLTEQERSGARRVSDARAREIARQSRARYYVDGIVSNAGDSTSVLVRLYDANDGGLLKRAVQSGLGNATSVEDLALRAAVQLMPTLTGLSQLVDVSTLTGRRPAAVNSWLRGEREFRNRHMDAALHHLEQAVTEDSMLAPAAFRAAIAAGWTNRTDTAVALVRLALRHPERLAPRQRPFAVALERFLSGRANEAMIALRPALTPSEETADAWMLAGEIQFHLLPTVGVDSTAHRAVPSPTVWPYEALANDAFLRSRQIDQAFTPPLAHLAELAARRGDASAARSFVSIAMAAWPDSVFSKRLDITNRCLRGGQSAVKWTALAREDPRTMFYVGSVLQSATEPRARACGLAAFGSILLTESPAGSEYWNSLLAMHGMLIAQGESAKALALVDSAMANGLSSAVGLFVIDAAAGIDVGQRTTAFIEQLQSSMSVRGPTSLWLLCLDASRTADTVRLVKVTALLAQRTKSATAQRLDTLMSQASLAWLALAQRDTAVALQRFADLSPSANGHDLQNSLWEALAPERLRYAQLLLAVGRPAEAHRVASTFEHPGIFVHQIFLLSALDVRLRAANAMKDLRLARQAQETIARLKRVAAP